MVTMKEATIAYDEHYYAGKGMEIAKDIDAEVSNPIIHDMFHIIASGVPFIAREGNIKQTFQFMESNGLIERLAGIKAELLEELYLYTFSQCDKNLNVSFSEMKKQLDAQCYFVSSKMNIYTNERDTQRKTYSNIEELQDLLKSYKTFDTSRLENFLTDEEIQFHMDKAIELYGKLKSLDPDCELGNGKMDYDYLLNMDIRKFAINNFTPIELAKLRNKQQLHRGLS